MADFKDKNTGEIITVPETEIEDIATLRGSADFEEVMPETPVTPTKKQPSLAESFLRGGGQGLSLGFSDELMGLGAKLGDYLASKTQNLGYRPSERDYIAEEREKNRVAQEANPGTYFTGELAGSLVLPGGTAKGAAKLPMAARLARQAAVGAGTGLVEGAGRADSQEGLLSEDTATQAARSALIGGLGAPAGDIALTGLTKAGTKGARRAMEIFDPQGTLLKKAQVIEETGKKLAGKSPTEELAEAERLIGQHGKAVKEALAENTQRQVQDDLSGIVRGNDVVMTQANTSLKGTAAMKNLGVRLESIPIEQRARFRQNVFDKSGEQLDKIRTSLGKIKQRAKGRLASTSAGTQSSRIETAIESYEKILTDVMSDPSPAAMSDAYIALDNVKRALGTAQGKIREDETSKQAIRGAYMKLRGFLENEKIWGPEVTGMQKEINKAWSKYLDVENAIESSFMRGRSKQAMKAEDTFEKLTEAEGSKVASFLSDPGSATNSADLRNLQNWLDSSEELTGVLTKYYKDVPELQGQVGNIRNMRKRVLENIERAKQDVTRAKKPGTKPEDLALFDIDVATQRGVPSESIGEIRSLQAQRSALEDPKIRLGRELSYSDKVGRKTGELYDKAPIFGPMRTAERVVRMGVPGMSAYAGSSDTVQAMWGDRPISTVESDKASVKAIENDNSISRQDKDEIYLNRSIEDRKKKPSKTKVF